MIHILDGILRDLFIGRVPGITSDAQVRFQPPDDDWRTYVSNLTVGGNPVNAVNVYLADLRENRRLRSNARTVVAGADYLETVVAPNRVDLHYLVSAWSPTQLTPMTEPSVEEHELLYNLLAVLMNNAPLNPNRVYPPGSAALLAVPAIIRSADLPTQIAPLEGFPKLVEFWGTMGENNRHKPAIQLVVTLPVVLSNQVEGPMVTTLITHYQVTGVPVTDEVWVQIGGTVLDAAQNPAVPVPGAWVQLQTAAGEPLQTASADNQGRFSFLGLQPGNYQLAFRAQGHNLPGPRAISVPSPSGEYDLRFT